MDINKILAQVDAFFEENRGEDAERLMQQSIVEAVREQDDDSLLHLLNELLGYYRETSQKENVFKLADQAIAQAARMGLEGTVPYATTLLNVANAYRACGKLQESMEYYLQVQEIYDRQLEPDSMFMAGLKNNMSLLCQEMGDFAGAKEKLMESLAIVEKSGAAYELGVTYANLAGTCMQLSEPREAYEYATKSLEVFRRANVTDSHYAAALATLGAYFYGEGDFDRALQYYTEAQETVERSLGKNEYYRRLQEYVSACEKALGADRRGIEQEKGGEGEGEGESEEKGGREKAKSGEKARVEEKAEEEENRREKTEGKEGEAKEPEEREGIKIKTEGREGKGEKPEKNENEGEEIGKKANGEAEQLSDEEKKDREGTDGRGRQGVGLGLAREYYETFGRPMIEENFPAYAGKIAVGLAGRGSDCFGYDDETSRDHDWGPEFCMWVTEETYEEIGEALQRAYEGLPKEFGGYARAPYVSGRRRRGVIKISDFYRELVGAAAYEQIDWRSVPDSSLAAAVNGEVFRDDEGIFTAYREKLMRGYPEEIRYLKLAESAAKFSQSIQYNYPRTLRRGDSLTADLFVRDGVREAMKLQLYIEGKYPPHDKWLHRRLRESETGREISARLTEIVDLAENAEIYENKFGNHEKETGSYEDKSGNHEKKTENYEKETAECIERLGAFFAMELYGGGFISDTDSYLDAHSEELVYKASLAGKSVEELSEDIAKLEFEAFDKVRNEGGRASCQNDWYTFSIMRKSQYLTWNKTMLTQYLYDFDREYRRGHNLIEEKYGRMMESTAPEQYKKIKSHFPELSQEKKNIIEQIVRLQVGWMEEFSENYPALAGNARNIHTWEDNSMDTSYETYLRGELGTYSDKMLELYGRYVVDYVRENRNLTYDIMENSVKMYGYANLQEAEEKEEKS